MMGLFNNMISAFLASEDIVRKNTETMSEPTFGGVPLSELNELAKSVPRGVRVTIDNTCGALVFHHLSSRGKTLTSQIFTDEFGKLVNYGVHYPGQWKSAADYFVEAANERFTFKR